MLNKRCFFVIGPEGSGTYMMAEALVEAGCTYVAEEKDLRNYLMENDYDPIVIRRSIPHAGKFLDLPRICDDIWWAVYNLIPVVMVREPNATIKSVQRRNPQEANKVKYNMKIAWQNIGDLAKLMAIRPIPYEALIHSPDFVDWLFEDEWGLSSPLYSFTDQNRKYYNG